MSWTLVRAFTHLVDWVDYHAVGNAEPSTCPARVTFYSSAPAAPTKDVA